MANTKRILSEFRKAINFHTRSQVVDLDISFSEKFEFIALRLEDVFRVSKTVPPNRWSFHRIGIITQGNGEFQTGIYRFPAKKNTLVIVPARVMTASRNWTPDVKGLLILFNLEFLIRRSFSYKAVRNKKILTPFIKTYLYLNDEDAGRITNIFEALMKEQAERNQHCEELIAVKVIELVIECERLFAQHGNLEKDVSSNNVVAAFDRLLEKYFQQHRDVSFYASKLHVHPNYLNSLLKKYTGDTAKGTINHRLLIEAKYLLHSTTLSIKEIAYQAGFEDPNYFTSFFKRMEKISPAAYRASAG